MAIVGIFGDAHITKNMRSLQNEWDKSVVSSFTHMYKKFDEERVDFVVGLGDLLDAPEIKAKHLNLLRPIFQLMNLRDYSTYLLLGNHEIDSDTSNILEYLSEYKNIIPVTDADIIRNEFSFIPYNVDPAELDSDYIEGKYVFTHHDIYGSELAGGRTKAFFGIDPGVFSEALLVMNGHVHLRSRVRSNIVNAGSLLVSSQGELRLGDYPKYYILDSSTGLMQEYDNEYSMIYLTTDPSKLSEISRYNESNLVLRVEYSGALPDVVLPEAAHISYRKLIDDISSSDVVSKSNRNFDMKSYLSEYIKKDSSVAEEDKGDYIKKGVELLS